MSRGPGTGGTGSSGATGGPRSAAARPSPVAAGTAGPDPSTPGPSPASRRYAETLVPEHPAAAAARSRAEQVGVVPVSPGVAATLSFLAAATSARAAVEIGTGTGVSALALLSGLAAGGVLTSVEIEGEHTRLARAAMSAAGIPATRARLINGRALDVLPRLTDGAYDIVLADADPAEDDGYLTEALRLLRPGGLVAINGALAGDAAGDPARGGPGAAAARALHQRVLEDERLAPVLLPVGTGLLVAALVA